MRQFILSLALLLLPQAVVVWGFVVPPSIIRQQHAIHTHNLPTTTHSFTNWARVGGQQLLPRRGSVRMQGIFGLGLGEIAVILVVVGFVLGPQNIGRLLRSSVDRASALKDELDRVPEEFQKGMEEGESNVRARKAKRIKVVKDSDDDA